MADAHELEMLIRWVQTFDQFESVADGDKIRDGVAICDVAHEIIPTFFSEDLMAKVRRDPGNNDRFKVMNLQKAAHTLAAFLAAKFKVSEDEIPTPSEAAIVEGDDLQLTVLLRLLVTCAVNSSNREEYVQRILADNEMAKAIMSSIQSIQTNLQSAAEEEQRVRAGSDADDPALSRLQKQLDETRHSLRHLQIEHEAVVDDNRELERELEETRASLTAARESGTGSSAADQQRIHDLSAALTEAEEALKAEQLDHETTKKDCQRALAEMKRQMEKAMEELSDMQGLKDEVQELRQQADQVPALESRLATLKAQLEEAAELKRQAVSAQEQNAENIKRIVALEEKEKRVEELQQELDEAAQKMAALEEELLTEQKQSDRLKHELSVQKDANNRLKEEKTRLLREKGSLEQQLELSSTGDISAAGLGGGVDLERLIRLEHENATLRAQVEGATNDDKVSKMKDMLEAAQKAKQELQVKNRELSLQIAKLETEINNFKDSDTVQSASDVAIEKLAVCERQLTATKKELASKTDAVKRLKTQLSKAQEDLLEAQKKLSLVGMDQKEMAEEARTAALKDVQEKLDTLGEREKELEKLSERMDKLSKERDQLSQENTEMTKRITTLLTQKDELNSKLLQLREQGVGGEDAAQLKTKLQDVERQLQERTQQLNAARHDYKRLEDTKIEEASQAADAGEQGSTKYVRLMQNKVEQLEKQLKEKATAYDRLRASCEREQRLMTSAWVSLSVEQQKLSVRERERTNAAPRGQSFLEVQRRKAMDRKTVSHAS